MIIIIIIIMIIMMQAGSARVHVCMFPDAPICVPPPRVTSERIHNTER